MTDSPMFESYIQDSNSLRAVKEASDLPTERSRSGQPTLSFLGIRLHSSVDPVREAETLFESHRSEIDAALNQTVNETVTCVLLGAGLGYLVKALGEHVENRGAAQRVRVVCIESDPEVARKALQLRIWEPCSLDVTWLVGALSADTLMPLKQALHRLVFADTQGYRMNKAAYAEALQGLENRCVAERPMRILVPTPLYGGSLPMAFHCADAFRDLGHQVEVLDLSAYYPLYGAVESVTGDLHHRKALQGLLATYLSEVIAARAMDWKADLVWAVAQTPLTPASLEEMRHEGIHSAFWFVEDYTVFGYWRELAPHCDAVFTIQRGAFHDALRDAGVANIAYLPCAANPAVHYPRALSAAERERYGSDVSFVGAGYPNRQLLFAELALKNFKIWGADWPTDAPAYRYVQEKARRVAPDETAIIYSASTVNLNLHSSPHHIGVNPHGDYVNPRTFEIAACGGFQLVDARSELAANFKEGEEVATFHSAEEIPQLIEYYLSHPEERAEIAERSRARLLREHTYAHRMAAALDFLESRFRRLAERKRGPNYVSSLKAAVSDDPELTDFLSGFPENEEIDLDQIVSRIEVGKGELTRAEGIFLLMKEFRDWGREKGVIQ